MPKRLLLSDSRSEGRVTKNRQAGFTLIETMLVMAIGAGLAMVVLLGQGELKRRVQFTDSVELAKNTLVKIKNEANTTVNQGGGTGGTDPNQIFFAKRVTFANNSSVLQVDTLVINPTLSTITPLAGNDAYTATLPWRVTYRATNSTGVISTGKEVLFVRWPPTGKLYMFTPPVTGFNDTNFSSYNPTDMANRDQKLFQLEDADNTHRAVLQIEGTTGTIGRVFN